MDNIFSSNSKRKKPSPIAMSYVYKIIVSTFMLKNEKLLLNLICSQNLLAPLAALYEAKVALDIYEQEVRTV